MKAIAYGVLALAALTSAIFVGLLKPTSTDAALAFGAWLALPYAVLALCLVFFAKDPRLAPGWLLLIVIVAGGGLLFLALILFGRPDAQGGIAVVFTPIYQTIGAVVLAPLCLWLARQSAR